jgi:hypothetical protein
MAKRIIADEVSPLDYEEDLHILNKSNVVQFADNLRLPIKVPGSYRNPKSIGYGQVGFQPTDEQRKLVYMLRAHGMTLENICQFVTNQFTDRPITDETLRKHFRYELDMAMTEVNVCVSQKMLEGALGCPAQYDDKGRVIRKERQPQFLNQQWWEKTRGGYKETSINEHAAGQGTKVTLIIEG